jgi:hypothetical protein
MPMATESKDQVAQFLKAKRVWPYCDDCICEKIAAASIEEVSSETVLLKKQIDFLPVVGVCTGCGQRKVKMIMAI